MRVAAALGLVLHSLTWALSLGETRKTPMSGLSVAVACRDGCIVATDASTYLADGVVFKRTMEGEMPKQLRVLRSGAVVAASGAIVDFETLLSEYLAASCSSSRACAPVDLLYQGNSGAAGVELFSGELVLGTGSAAELRKRRFAEDSVGSFIASRRSGLSAQAFLHFCSNALHHIGRYKAEKEPLDVDIVAAGPRTVGGAEERPFVVGRVSRKGGWTGQAESVVAAGRDAGEALAFLRPRLASDSTVEEAEELLLKCFNSRRKRSVCLLKLVEQTPILSLVDAEA